MNLKISASESYEKTPILRLYIGLLAMTYKNNQRLKLFAKTANFSKIFKINLVKVIFYILFTKNDRSVQKPPSEPNLEFL